MKEKIIVNAIVAILFLVVAGLIALRLTHYFEFSWPWYVVVVLSAAGAAVLLFWTGRSR